MNRYFLFFIALLFYNFSVAQSIVNTEKLFIDNEDGFAVSSELMGSSIQGNADVLLVEYSLNFAYKKAKNYCNIFLNSLYFSIMVMSKSFEGYPNRTCRSGPPWATTPRRKARLQQPAPRHIAGTIHQ